MSRTAKRLFETDEQISGSAKWLLESEVAKSEHEPSVAFLLVLSHIFVLLRQLGNANSDVS